MATARKQAMLDAEKGTVYSNKEWVSRGQPFGSYESYIANAQRQSRKVDIRRQRRIEKAITEDQPERLTPQEQRQIPISAIQKTQQKERKAQASLQLQQQKVAISLLSKQQAQRKPKIQMGSAEFQTRQAQIKEAVKQEERRRAYEADITQRWNQYKKERELGAPSKFERFQPAPTLAERAAIKLKHKGEAVTQKRLDKLTFGEQAKGAAFFFGEQAAGTVAGAQKTGRKLTQAYYEPKVTQVKVAAGFGYYQRTGRKKAGKFITKQLRQPMTPKEFYTGVAKPIGKQIKAQPAKAIGYTAAVIGTSYIVGRTVGKIQGLRKKPIYRVVSSKGFEYRAIAQKGKRFIELKPIKPKGKLTTKRPKIKAIRGTVTTKVGVPRKSNILTFGEKSRVLVSLPTKAAPKKTLGFFSKTKKAFTKSLFHKTKYPTIKTISPERYAIQELKAGRLKSVKFVSEKKWLRSPYERAAGLYAPQSKQIKLRLKYFSREVLRHEVLHHKYLSLPEKSIYKLEAKPIKIISYKSIKTIKPKLETGIIQKGSKIRIQTYKTSKGLIGIEKTSKIKTPRFEKGKVKFTSGIYPQPKPKRPSLVSRLMYKSFSRQYPVFSETITIQRQATVTTTKRLPIYSELIKKGSVGFSGRSAIATTSLLATRRKTVFVTKSASISKPKAFPIYKTRQLSKTKPKSAISSISRTRQLTKTQLLPVTAPSQRRIIKEEFPTFPKPKIIIVPPPIFKRQVKSFSFKSLAPRISPKQSFRYAPTLRAYTFKITGPRPKGRLTGLEERPISKKSKRFKF